MSSKWKTQWPLTAISLGTIMLLIGFQNCQKAPIVDDEAARVELKKMLETKEGYGLYGSVYPDPPADSSLAEKSLLRYPADFGLRPKSERFDFKTATWSPDNSALEAPPESYKFYTLGKNGWTELQREGSYQVTWESENIASLKRSDESFAGKIRLIDFWNPTDLEVLSTLNDLFRDNGQFYQFKYLVPPSSLEERVRFSNASLIYQLRLQLEEQFSLTVPPDQYLESYCIKDKDSKCLQRLDQITSAKIRKYYRAGSYELQPQSDGTVKAFTSNNLSGSTGNYDLVVPSLGEWQRRTIGGVSVIIIKPPSMFLERSDSPLILAIERNGLLLEGDYSPTREMLSYLFNNAFTDDVAQMMSKYQVAK